MSGVHEKGRARRHAERAVGRILGEGTAKFRYLTRPTSIDRVLEIILLPFLPRRVTPNQLTVFRLAVTPVVVALLLMKVYAWGTALFILAALSDAADGALARTTNRVTAWGIMFDPVADKLLIGSVALILVPAYLGAGLAWAIVAVEAVLVASVYLRYGGKVVPAKMAGKIKMILQCAGLVVLLIYVNLGTPVLLSLAAFTLYASLFFSLLSVSIYRSI